MRKFAILLILTIVKTAQSIYVPSQNQSKNTLNSLGIKTIEWQDTITTTTTTTTTKAPSLVIHQSYSGVQVQRHNNTRNLEEIYEENRRRQPNQQEHVENYYSGKQLHVKESKTPQQAYEKCPGNESGLFVYELACNKYLNCWNGRGFVQNCPPGTLFNPRSMECDLADKVQCLNSVVRVGRADLSDKPQASCPQGFSGLIPHYKDCSKFITCHNGVDIMSNCPPGTLFDYKTNVCDFPYKCLCANGERHERSSDKQQQFKHLGSSKSRGSNQNLIAQETSQKCPTSFTGLMPHDSDCGKFLNCANGRTYIQSCAPGTLFNPRTKTCDFPANVKCGENKPQNFETLQPAASTHSHFQPGAKPCQQGGGSSCGRNQPQSNFETQQPAASTHTYNRQPSSHFQPSVKPCQGRSNCGEPAPSRTPDLTNCQDGYNCASPSSQRPPVASHFVPNVKPPLRPQPSKDCIPGYNCPAIANPSQSGVQPQPQSSHDDCPPGYDCFPIVEDPTPTTRPSYNYPARPSGYNNTQRPGYNYPGKTNYDSKPSKSNTQDCIPGYNCPPSDCQGANCQPSTRPSYNQPPNRGDSYPSGFNQTQGPSYNYPSKTNCVGGNCYASPSKNDCIPGYNCPSSDCRGPNCQPTTRPSYNYPPNRGGTYPSNFNNTSGPSKVNCVGGNCYEGNTPSSKNDCISGYNCPSGSSNTQPTYYNPQSPTFPGSGSSSTRPTYYNPQSPNYPGSNPYQPHGFGMVPPPPPPSSQRPGYNHPSTCQGANCGQPTSPRPVYNNYPPIAAPNHGYNQPPQRGSSSQPNNCGPGQAGNCPPRTDLSTASTTYYGASTPRTNRAWPPPFPATDTNADYVFDYDDATEMNLAPPESGSSTRDCGFDCGGYNCIAADKVCNDVKDCANGRDEIDCTRAIGDFTRTPNTKLAVREQQKIDNITLKWCAIECVSNGCKSFNYRLLDGACFILGSNVGASGALIIMPHYDYYEYRAFSVNCSESQFLCANQKCIERGQICDGVNDCGDWMDEKHCQAEKFGYRMRLAGSDFENAGRIEIDAFGRTGYVCDDMFGYRSADVACRELGFPLGALEIKGNSYFAQDLNEQNTFYMMDDVNCNGNETRLMDCDFNGWGVHNCRDQEIVGVICKTAIEECPEDSWPCANRQQCLQLPFVCDGFPHCSDQSDEGSHCNAQTRVRLANGSNPKSGRVEILHNNIWGTICDDDFNDDAGKVVCNQLGYPNGGAIVMKNSFFGPGRGPIWLDQVVCKGNEASLADCEHWDWSEHNCDHNEDVGVICLDTEGPGKQRNLKLDEQLLNEANETLPETCGLRKDAIFNRRNSNDDVHFRVVQGSQANTGEYPWQASLRIRGKLKSSHWCGAVVISQHYVLTAAHCLKGFSKGSYFVVAGDYNVDVDEGTEQQAYIEDFLLHEDFGKVNKVNNDIAIVRLKGKGFVLNDDVQAICLPPSDVLYNDYMNCTISGFGSIENGKSRASKDLRAGWVPIQPKAICTMPHIYGDAITGGMFCAGSLEEGVDACDGDSGGPLACLNDGVFTLYGITSWGQHCGYANKPGVYVNVAYYREWISEAIKKLNAS